MPNSMTLRVSSFWQIGAAAIVLWTAPSCLLSQQVALSSPPVPSTGRPFFEVDESLSRTADAVLNLVGQISSPVTGQKDNGNTASAFPDQHEERLSSPSVGSGLSVSEMRMNLIRPVVDPILVSHKVPVDLAAVILVESGGRATALSPKGARGIWQLMPDTARRYGLRVDEVRDDRLDLFRSTDAAARYLHDLYAQFGDWKLALAAYNTGEANVGSAIMRAHTQDFDQLANLRMLPLETRNYVPRVLAAAQSFELSSRTGESPGSHLEFGYNKAVTVRNVFAESFKLP